MLYILTENWYSGSVTVGTEINAIEAPDFETAKKIAKTFIEKVNGNVSRETDDSLHWDLPSQFTTGYGFMESTPLKVLNA